jgi:hypothetical protein
MAEMTRLAWAAYPALPRPSGWLPATARDHDVPRQRCPAIATATSRSIRDRVLPHAGHTVAWGERRRPGRCGCRDSYSADR